MTKQTQTELGREIYERDKNAIRKEIVEYLNKFNADNYPAIEPLLRRTNMNFFAMASGNAVPEEDAHWSISYYILFGREPRVAVFGTHGGWTYPLIRRSEALEIIDLGSGRIKLPRRAGYRHTIDVLETAASADTGYDYLNAIDLYRKEVEADFARNLDFLKIYIACREDKK